MVDVSSKMPMAHAEAAPGHRTVAAQPVAGNDPLPIVTTFSDVLQASLKNAAAATSHSTKGRGVPGRDVPSTSGTPALSDSALSDSAPSATLASPVLFQGPVGPWENSPRSLSIGSVILAGEPGNLGGTADAGSGDPMSPGNRNLTATNPSSDSMGSGFTTTSVGNSDTSASALAPPATLTVSMQAWVLPEPSAAAQTTTAEIPGSQTYPAGPNGTLAATPDGTQPAPPLSASEQKSDSTLGDASGASAAVDGPVVSASSTVPSTVPSTLSTTLSLQGQPGAPGDRQSLASLLRPSFALDGFASSVRGGQPAPSGKMPSGGEATAVPIPLAVVPTPGTPPDSAGATAATSDVSGRTEAPGDSASSKDARSPSLPMKSAAASFPSAQAKPVFRMVGSAAIQPSSAGTLLSVAQEPSDAGDASPLLSLGTERHSPASAHNPPSGSAGANEQQFFPADPAAEWGTDLDAPTLNPVAEKPALTSLASAPAGNITSAPSAPSTIPAILAIPTTGHNDSKSGSASADAPSAQTAPQQPSEDGPELSAGLRAWNGGESAAVGTGPSDRLAGTLASSEMNVALRAEGLGAVQVHTRVTGDQVGAAITVEHRDAHAALTSDLPALHQALSHRQLRLENVSLSQGSPHAGSGAGDRAGRQQHPGGASQRAAHSGGAVASFLGAAESISAPEASETRTAFDSNGRLSVQA
jgi:flagellar hook-length control protein FliK